MTAARPDKAPSNGRSVSGRGRCTGEAVATATRIEFELSVARPLATLQLWSGIIASRLLVDWQPDRASHLEDADPALQLGAAGLQVTRPLEPGVPYPWPDPGALHQINQKQAQLIFEVELVR